MLTIAVSISAFTREIVLEGYKLNKKCILKSFKESIWFGI